MKKNLLLFVVAVCMAACTSQAKEVPIVYTVENTGADYAPPAFPTVDQLPSVPMLPDPFAWSDGSGRVEKFSEWPRRRAEIMAELEHYELGKKPGKPADLTASYADGTLTVTILKGTDTLVLTSRIVMPTGEGPHPVIIGVNRPTGSLPAKLFPDFIQVPFVHNQVSMHSRKDSTNSIYSMYPELLSSGNYIAWCWGISRLIDGLELVQSQIGADMGKIAINGCSYAGKMALFGGAFDERIALTIVQESGGGGINAWRVSDTLGEVEKIANTSYDWFLPALRDNFNGQSDKLPYDHHELVALIAPRPVVILGNPDFAWLADESGYISSMAALQVWEAMGVADRFGFDFSPDHPHCQTTDSQNALITAFVDKFFRGKSDVNTVIRYAPLFGEVDYHSWISAWEGHKLRMNK